MYYVIMRSTRTVNRLQSLPKPIRTYIVENVMDTFVIGYRIPDSFFASRSTWFMLCETQLVVIDSVYPFRVFDKFSLIDVQTDVITQDGDQYIWIHRDETKDIFIQLDSTDTNSTRFKSLLFEQTETIQTKKEDDSDIFTF